MCSPEATVSCMSLKLLCWCSRQWLTSSQVHLCAAALWVAVNSTLIHSSRRVHWATVGRVCFGSPYYYPADIKKGQRIGNSECFHTLQYLWFVYSNYMKNVNLLPSEKVTVKKKNITFIVTFVLGVDAAWTGVSDILNICLKVLIKCIIGSKQQYFQEQ